MTSGLGGLGGLGFAHRLFFALSVAFGFSQVVSVLMMVFGKRGQGLSAGAFQRRSGHGSGQPPRDVSNLP